MHLILALLLQATPTATPAQETRAVVAKKLDQFDRNIEKLAGFVNTRFSSDSDVPRTGLAVSSEDMDSNGLHPIIVVTVIKGSPADTAGILPGDRVLQVGQRRIEHETAQVFRIITDGTAGPLELTVRRNGRDMTVHIIRAPVACLQRSSASIDQAKWNRRLADLRKLSRMVRAELDDETIMPVEMRYRTSKDHLVKLFGVFDELSQTLSGELTQAMARECTFRSLP